MFFICPYIECGNTLRDNNGTITKPSPIYNDSTFYTTCGLIVDTRTHNDAQHALHLEFHVINFDVTGNMPSCNHGNYIEIFIGCKFVSIGRFCGVKSFLVFYSTDGCLGLSFHGVVKDFQATYSVRSSKRG